MADADEKMETSIAMVILEYIFYRDAFTQKNKRDEHINHRAFDLSRKLDRGECETNSIFPFELLLNRKTFIWKGKNKQTQSFVSENQSIL